MVGALIAPGFMKVLGTLCIPKSNPYPTPNTALEGSAEHLAGVICQTHIKRFYHELMTSDCKLKERARNGRARERERTR